MVQNLAACTDTATKIANIVNDPRFQQGLKLKKDKKWDQALEFLGRCVEIVTKDEAHQLDLPAAPVYYHYGDVLLTKAQETSDVFGEGIQEAQRQKQAEREAAGGDENTAPDSAEVEEGERQDDDDDDEQEEDVEKKQLDPEVQEDLQIAWENLDVARVIWEKHPDEVEQKQMAEVYLRLADCHAEQSRFKEAIEEYEKALNHYCTENAEGDRYQANIHFLIGRNYVYASGLVGNERQRRPMMEKSKEHYSTCAEIFENLSKRAKTEGNEETVGDLIEILTELRETIEAIKQDLRGGLPTSEHAATTIGFGAKDTNGPTAAGSAASGSIGTTAAPVNLISTKKKSKASTNGSGNGGTRTVDESNATHDVSVKRSAEASGHSMKAQRTA